MSDHKDNLGSGFLYSETLIHKGDYGVVWAEIEEVIRPNTIKSADGKFIDKPVLRFVGHQRMLVLNKTNTSMVPIATSQSLYESVGRKIMLQVRDVKSFGGTTEPAIRIMPPEGVKIRKKLLERLGTRAVLNPGQPKQEPKPDAKKEQGNLIDTGENIGQ